MQSGDDKCKEWRMNGFDEGGPKNAKWEKIRLFSEHLHEPSSR